jgi:hypothetical protein
MGMVGRVSLQTQFSFLFDRQGCSKAILGAVTLNTVLKSLDSRKSSGSLPANFSKLFFEAQAAKIDPIWYGLHKNISIVVADVDLGRERRLLVCFG